MFKRWMFFAFAVVICVGAFCYAVFSPAYRAKSFLSAFIATDPSTATFNQVNSLFAMYKGNAVPNAEACVTSECVLEVRFENRLLAACRIAPLADMRISASIANKKILYTGAMFGVGEGKNIPIVFVTELLHVDDPVPLTIQPVIRPEGQVQEVHLKVSSGTKSRLRHLIFAFDTRCFNSIRGCRSIDEILPTLKELQSTTGK